jgi:hypothetical protein
LRARALRRARDRRHDSEARATSLRIRAWGFASAEPLPYLSFGAPGGVGKVAVDLCALGWFQTQTYNLQKKTKTKVPVLHGTEAVQNQKNLTVLMRIIMLKRLL